MRIILLDNVENMGTLGDHINVKPGYARNFLIPKGKAVLATKKNIEYFQDRRAALEASLAKAITDAKNRAEEINLLGSITIKSKAGSGGKLFGSVGARDIANAVTKAGVKVDKNEVRLPNGILRTIGSHEVYFRIQSKVFAKIAVNIVASCDY